MDSFMAGHGTRELQQCLGSPATCIFPQAGYHAVIDPSELALINSNSPMLIDHLKSSLDV